MKKIIIAAIVCGLTIGSMLIGFNLYQQKQEEIRQEELRLEEEARLKAEAEEKARKEAEEKAKQEEFEKAWRAKYVEVVVSTLAPGEPAIEKFVDAYYNAVLLPLVQRYGVTVDISVVRNAVDSNTIVNENLKILEDLQSQLVLDMTSLSNYPSGYYQAYTDLHSMVYWFDEVVDMLKSDSYLYENNYYSSNAQLDILKMYVDSLNNASDKVEVWVNLYDSKS